jgi:hypothetical protein
MAGTTGIPHLVIIILVVVLAFRSRNFLRTQGEMRHMPAYSAETTRGTEAQFIRDRLPVRFPTILALLALVTTGALAWWWCTH